MKDKCYSQKTLILYEEANKICNSIYDSDIGCIGCCKYVTSHHCKVSCLEEKYNIVNLKTLQPLDIKDYVKTKNICVIFNEDCYEYPDAKCSTCLLEALLKDKDIVFIKKGE